MRSRPFGNTGLQVSPLGFGAGKIGDPATSESEVSTLLNTAVDQGITFFDTARSYGLSEERIGKHLRHRRKEIVLSTKVGYGIEGIPDWTGPCITAGIDLALRLLQTDCIDIVHLHSCPVETLENGEVVPALLRAVENGKVRVAGYSGDNTPARRAVNSGVFQSIQMSINVCDQAALEIASLAADAGMGVIAKRPLANAVWRLPEPPLDDTAAAAYWTRWRDLALQTGGMDPTELALRFVLSLPDITVCLPGTRSAENLRRNVRFADLGALPPEMVQDIRARFDSHRSAWQGMI